MANDCHSLQEERRRQEERKRKQEEEAVKEYRKKLRFSVSHSAWLPTHSYAATLCTVHRYCFTQDPLSVTVALFVLVAMTPFLKKERAVSASLLYTLTNVNAAHCCCCRRVPCPALSSPSSPCPQSVR